MKRPAILTNPDLRRVWDALDELTQRIAELGAQVADHNTVILQDREPKRRKPN